MLGAFLTLLWIAGSIVALVAIAFGFYVRHIAEASNEADDFEHDEHEQGGP